MSRSVLSAFFLVLLIPGNSTGHLSRPRSETDCRCVPDQWECEIISKETEFQFASGRPMTSFRGESKVVVHYDFEKRLLATTETETGMKSIEDYGKGLKYTTDEDGKCRAIFIGGTPMEQMCIPDTAVRMGEFRLATEHHVIAWQWTTHDNYTKTTVVDKTSCLPISEESIFATDDYVEIVSYLYVNASLRIKDPEVFQPEANCRLLDFVGLNGISPQRRRRRNLNM